MTNSLKEFSKLNFNRLSLSTSVLKETVASPWKIPSASARNIQLALNLIFCGKWPNLFSKKRVETLKLFTTLTISWLWYSEIQIQDFLKTTKSLSTLKLWPIYCSSLKSELMRTRNCGVSTFTLFSRDSWKGFIWKDLQESSKSVQTCSDRSTMMTPNLMLSKLDSEKTNKTILNFWNVSLEFKTTCQITRPSEKLRKSSDSKNLGKTSSLK